MINASTSDSSSMRGLLSYIRGETGLDEVFDVDSGSLERMTELTYLLYQNGKYEQALTLSGGLISLKPKNAYFHLLRAGILDAMGKTEEAVDEYDETLELDPQNKPALVNKGEIMLRCGRLDAAAYCLKRAISLDDGKDPWPDRARALAVTAGETLSSEIKKLENL